MGRPSRCRLGAPKLHGVVGLAVGGPCCLGDVPHDDLAQLGIRVSAGDAIAHDLEVRLMGAADGYGPPAGDLHVLLGAGGPEEGHHVGGWFRLCHQGGWVGEKIPPP